ncbi:MAG TPA: hypothetical protein VNT01_11600 [Symbiobacteriaceae bacterium]|nr:hypothetical protein [Symbiobacteriaceae bacterium]
MLRRTWDPRLNPTLRPDEWQRVSQRNRLRVALAAAAILSVLAGVAAYLWYPTDRTRDLSPEAVVETAGLALLQAGQYRFEVELSGQSQEYPFPGAALKGEYQRTPPVIHLAGDVDSGESTIALEYYLQGSDLYMLHPITQDWLVTRNSSSDELTSFDPENLAAPFLGGVLGVEELGRERLPGGPAVRYRLDLAPEVMLPRQPDLHSDAVQYELWVYTRTLEPARFSMQVVRKLPAEGQQPVNTGDRFTYQLTWQFRGLQPLTVPEAVTSSAHDVGSEEMPPGAP